MHEIEQCLFTWIKFAMFNIKIRTMQNDMYNLIPYIYIYAHKNKIVISRAMYICNKLPRHPGTDLEKY